MGERTWPNLLAALLRAEELSTADTAWAMGEIMSGSATPAQIAGFAMALRAKGETPAELAGLVEAMLGQAALVDLPPELRAGAIDVVGTGGDRAHTVNISTMTAMVVAGAGVRVVKHGNRAASSSCGAADLRGDRPGRGSLARGLRAGRRHPGASARPGDDRPDRGRPAARPRQWGERALLSTGTAHPPHSATAPPRSGGPHG